MALTHLLDTSVLCQPIKPRPLAPVIQRWEALGDEALGVSVLCQAEILYGIALKGSSRLQAAYEAVLRDRLAVFPVNEAESQTYADMRATLEKAGKRLPDLDLLIAATAQTHGLVVATLNVRHFSLIANLPVEDWSVALS
ncbi:MAG: type II toxin-antitoxin system VapC family toxin [Planctomycetota bacterium]